MSLKKKRSTLIVCLDEPFFVLKQFIHKPTSPGSVFFFPSLLQWWPAVHSNIQDILKVTKNVSTRSHDVELFPDIPPS